MDNGDARMYVLGSETLEEDEEEVESPEIPGVTTPPGHGSATFPGHQAAPGTVAPDRAVPVAEEGSIGEEGTVAALFVEPGDAQDALQELIEEGFPRDHIGVLMRDTGVSRELVENPAAYVAEGAAMGAVEGGLLGGVLGFLVGALVVPGVGPLVAAGAMASALATAGSAALAGIGLGAATGGFVGALTGDALPEGHAARLEEGLRSGGVVIIVNAGDRTADALAILARNNGDTGPQHGNLNPLYAPGPRFVRPETVLPPEPNKEAGE